MKYEKELEMLEEQLYTERNDFSDSNREEEIEIMLCKLRFRIRKQSKKVGGCGHKFKEPKYRKYVDCTCGDFGWFFCEICRDIKLPKKMRYEELITKINSLLN